MTARARQGKFWRQVHSRKPDLPSHFIAQARQDLRTPGPIKGRRISCVGRYALTCSALRRKKTNEVPKFNVRDIFPQQAEHNYVACEDHWKTRTKQQKVQVPVFPPAGPGQPALILQLAAGAVTAPV